MYLEMFSRFEASDEAHEARWWERLHTMEGRGWTLTTMKVSGSWFDEETGESTWEKVTVRDWRTERILGIFTPQEFRELSFNREKWCDVEFYYELD